MNKKIKWAIPFAVLALTCGIAAGCSVESGHEHSYTEWGHNETQHWKECPEDHEKDDGTVKNHNFVDGSCECGATQQTPPVTDLTITDETTDTNGTVTLSKTTAKTGDSVTVTVAPNEGYQLKSLTVNGANVFGAMTGNTYEFTVSENTTVVAVFEKIASSSVNAVITGKKYGVTGNSLTAGTDITLSAAGREDVAAKLETEGENLVIKVPEIAGDNWSVKVDGYVATTIIVPRDAAYTTPIALEYDLMENLKNTWGNADSADLSNQNDGKIVHTGGYVQWISTKNSFDSVAITATVRKGGFRQGVFIRFAGDNYDDDKYVMVSKENQDKIGWCAMGGGSDYKGSAISPWEDNIKPLTKDEYELTLVRNGADIYFFVDGEYLNTKTFNDYADKECYVGLFCTDATKMENSERTFSIGTYDDFFKAVTITDTTEAGAKGKLELPEGEHKVGEQVEITVTPDSGYVVGSLMVNGTEYADRVANGKVTVMLTKATVELKATFAKSAFTASNAQCPQGTYDFDSYIINDKLVLGYKRYNAAGDAPSYGDLIGNGLDDITRYGNDFNGSIGNINFKANGTSNANCLFLDNGQYKDVTVKVPKNAKQILVFTGTYDGGDRTITCNLYNAEGNCVGNGTFLHTRGDNPRADLVTFDVDTTEFGTDGETFTLRIGGNCSTTVAAIVVLGEKHDVTITNGTTDTNGTVALTGTTENKITTGGQVTVTVTPSNGYRIKDLKVNGQSVLASVVDNEYTFIAVQDATVVAEFEQLQLVDVTLTINATDYANNAVTLADGTQITFTDVKGFANYTYTVGAEDNFAQMYVGTYTVACDGYFETTVTVDADNGEITVNLSEPIATPSANAGNEITVSDDKTITIHGNGIADRNNDRAISADLKLTDEQKTSTGLTLTFTVKGTKKDNRGGDDWAASRFGVQLGEGALGFFVFVRDNSAPTAADIVKLPENSLGMNGVEHKWHGDDPALVWLTVAAFSENGLQMKVERKNGVISVYAKNGENWVLLSEDEQNKNNGGTANENPTSGGDLTIANNVRNEIKFLGGGDHWTFSEITVTLPEASEKANLTTSVNKAEGQAEAWGTITTDIQNYYKGDKAIITVTANKGYELEKLVIGETEITEGWTKEGLVYTYELTLTGDTTVVAYIKETPIPQVTPNITVSGGKYGSTETPAIAEGTTVTLTNVEMGTEYVGTVGADGKLTFDKQLYVAQYKVSSTGYFDGTITITEDMNAVELKLYIETVDCEITVGETGDTAKFVAEGAKITFSKGDVIKEVTVTDGKVKIENVLTGDWLTTAEFGGYELHLGWTTVDTTGKASITVDAGGIMWAKKEQEIAASNIAEGTIEIKTDPAHHNKITLATAVEGGVMAFKFSLPADVQTKLATGDGKAAVTMPIGNGNGSLWVILYIEKSGENKTLQFAYYDKVSGGHWFDDNGAKRLDLSSYWDTLVNGGLWIVANVDAKTAAISTYVGATLETAVNAKYDRTCTLAPLSFDKIEIGNGLGGTTDNVCVTFKYGETLTALNVGKDVTLAKVNAEVTIGGTDSKYTAEGATLVFNHINGLYSVEGKVTNNKVSLTDIPVGEYKVGAKVNGLIVDLGSITVAEGDTSKTIALDAKPVFDPKKEQNYAGYDLAAGSFEIITNATYHNKIQFSQAGNGGALALKFALPAGTDTTGDFKAVTSMPLNFADGSMWIIFRIEKSGENKIARFGFTSVEGEEWWGSDASNCLDLSAQWDTIVNGGLWVVVDINAANGAIKTYTGASLGTVQDANFNRTCRSGNRIITALEIGNAIGNTDTNLCITLAYGATLDDVKALGGTDTSEPAPEPTPAE